MMRRRVPLAWLNLVHNKRRMAVSIAGITFATVLMFVEFGFLNAMFDSQTELIERLNGDLILVNKLNYTLTVSLSFTRRRLYQALAVPGIKTAVPLYIENRLLQLRSPRDGRRFAIRVFAFDPEKEALAVPEVKLFSEALKMPDTALMDTRSKAHFGSPGAGETSELAQRKIRIVGTFSLGTDFVNDGNMIMSDANFFRFFPGRLASASSPGRVEVGLIRLAPEFKLLEVKSALREALPDDVGVYTKEELRQLEMVFWKASTPVGFSFWLGTVMAFAVGVIVCYQILYTGVVDYLPQFGILKAVGFNDRYLVLSVLKQALALSLLGFFPGILVSRLFYGWISALTGLPMIMTPIRTTFVFVLTVGMCIVAGMLAVRKVLAADPAEVFE